MLFGIVHGIAFLEQNVNFASEVVKVTSIDKVDGGIFIFLVNPIFLASFGLHHVLRSGFCSSACTSAPSFCQKYRPTMKLLEACVHWADVLYPRKAKTYLTDGYYSHLVE